MRHQVLHHWWDHHGKSKQYRWSSCFTIHLRECGPPWHNENFWSDGTQPIPHWRFCLLPQHPRSHRWCRFGWRGNQWQLWREVRALPIFLFSVDRRMGSFESTASVVKTLENHTQTCRDLQPHLGCLGSFISWAILWARQTWTAKSHCDLAGHGYGHRSLRFGLLVGKQRSG